MDILFNPDFWACAASAIMPAIVSPFVLFLLPEWRFVRRRMYVVLFLGELCFILVPLLIIMILGTGQAALYLTGLLSPVMAFALLYFCSLFRDSRLIFLIVTLTLNASICDILTTMLVPRNCPEWIALFTGITLINNIIVYRYCKKPLLRMLDMPDVKWRTINIVPVSLIFSLVSFELYAMRYMGRRTPMLPSLCLCFTCVIIYLALYHVQQALLSHAKIEQYNSTLQSTVHYLQTQSSSAQAAEEKIRIYRHDTRHYLRLLQGQLEQSNISAALDLVEKLAEMNDTAVLSPTVITYTGHVMIDTVLNQTRELANLHQVEFEVKLSFPGKLRVDEVELAVVLSNALENAIYAASEAESVREKPNKVTVRTYPCRQELFLVIANTLHSPVQLNAETGLPVASSPSKNHGYGTLSMYQFAKKYQCTLDCSIKEQTFYLRLLI